METNFLKQSLTQLLQKSNAHADLETALKGLDIQNRGIKLPHLPYTIWQLVKHLQITQQYILDFSKNKNYKPLDWPKEYWPKENAPDNNQEWENTLSEIKKSLAEFTDLITDENNDLLKSFTHGDGQIVLIRRLLDDWQD